ncbi:MAG: transporter substrate-binding domain-containing protein [Prolixibacteraceae bacterium]|nr:transporter substrate-binding domain-containing protein [Prolixibacteraceae bacterium]
MLIITSIIIGCGNWNKSGKENSENDGQVINQLEQIKEKGELIAVVDYNSTNYFVYRGRPMGFQYELLQQLSNDLGVTLKVSVSNNLNQTFSGIENGQYDLVAKNLTVNRERKRMVDFTVPLHYTRQILVQRAKKEKEDDSLYVYSIVDLQDKTVHVQKNTAYYNRLVYLSDEIGKKINIAEDTIYGVEQLVARVANGEIDYTVCDENVAQLNKLFYPNLDISLRLSFPQKISWAVKKGSTDWKDFLDNWISEFKKTRKFKTLYHKYFESPRIVERMDSEYHSLSGGRISEYDELVKKIATQYNWDWRLISSIIYSESRFNPAADSWAGAKGLMQLMPNTAEAFGIENYEQPDQNILAGILFLNWLNNQLEESLPDSTERVNFVLAAYNVGLGHVNDARKLAEKYGANPNVWDNNVEDFLKKKSIEKYYNDSVVQWGYCRGIEATNYVEKVNDHFYHYLNVIDR